MRIFLTFGFMSQSKIIRPQEGFQMNFLASSADIVIGGSAAGVGKTFALLMEYLRSKDVKGFGGTIFRRTSPQIKLEGGLWDTSMQIYPYAGGTPRESSMEWKFGYESKLKFAHLEYEKNKLDYQGAQIPYIGFDELTHFTETMFFYLLSRNRSVCGVKPYVRATCNPDPESWVAKLISWWIDQETGYPIPERDGAVRYFLRYGENYIWGNSKQEVIDQSGFILDKMIEAAQDEADKTGKKNYVKKEDFVKSLSFISGSIYQNQELLKRDPGYLANLLNQDEATRKALLESNWKFVESDRDIYNYTSFRGMFDNFYSVKKKNKKRITVDVALKGRNKFIVSYFEGRSLEDMIIMDTSDGKQVLDAVKKMAKRHKVPNKRILFDADGVGGYLDGFIPGAIPFHGGGKVLEVYDEAIDKNIKENYQNLKTQLVYRSGQKVNKDKYRVSEKVAEMRYDDKMSVKERMIFERKAFKRDKVGKEGKLKITPKDEMKTVLQGDSPDILDTFFMNEYFEVQAQSETWEMDEKESNQLNY